MDKISNIKRSLSNPKILKTLLENGFLFESGKNDYGHQVETLAEYDEEMLDEMSCLVDDIEEKDSKAKQAIQDSSCDVKMSENELETMVREAFILGTLRSPFISNDYRKQIKENIDEYVYFVIDNMDTPSATMLRENAITDLYEDDIVSDSEFEGDDITGALDVVMKYYETLNEGNTLRDNSFNVSYKSIIDKFNDVAKVVAGSTDPKLVALKEAILSNQSESAFDMYRDIRGQLGKPFIDAFTNGPASSSFNAYMTGKDNVDIKLEKLCSYLTKIDKAYKNVEASITNIELVKDRPTDEEIPLGSQEDFEKRWFDGKKPAIGGAARDKKRFDPDSQINENLPAFKPKLGTDLGINKTESDKHAKDVAKKVTASQKTVQSKVEDDKISKQQKFEMNDFQVDLANKLKGKKGIMDTALDMGSNKTYDEGITNGAKAEMYDDEGGVEHTDSGTELLKAAKARAKEEGKTIGGK